MDWVEKYMDRNEQSFWGLLGLRFISAEGGKAQLGLTAGQEHLNSTGIVHGGVLSSMMDQAMGTLIASMNEGRFGVTTHLNINFLSPMLPGELIVTAFLLHKTHRTMTLRAEVRNEDGTLGCIATGTFRLPR